MSIDIKKALEQQDRAAKAMRRKIRGIARKAILTPDGKRFMELLKVAVKFDEPSFLPTSSGSYDPIAGAHRDGRKSVILDIEKFIALPNESDEGDDEENT